MFEENAKKQREANINVDIDKRCNQAGVDPAKIEINPKWYNKSESYATFEKEINQQINILIKEKEQKTENIKVVSAKADELGLPYQHWVEQLNNASLSDVLIEMDNYAKEVKKAAERGKKPKTKANKNVVEKNGKAIDSNTGEVIADYHIAYLISKKARIKLGGTAYQFNQLMQYLKDMGFKIEKVK